MNFIFTFLITSGVFATGDNHLFQSDQFVITNYTVDSGMPLNSANNIVQDHQGFLWISTYNGLVRFDGYEFTVFNAANTPAFPNNRITWIERSDLFPGIWLILETGGIIWYDYRDFHFYGRAEGFTNSHVLVIRDHPGGFMIIGTDNGTFSFDGNGFRRIYESDKTERNRAVDLMFDGELVWISTNAEPVIFNTETLEVKFPEIDGPPIAQTSSIAKLPDRPPVLGYASGVFTYENGRFVRNPRHRILQGIDIYDIIRLGDKLYISTIFGIFEDDGKRVVKLESTGLTPNTFLSTVFEDSRGRVWMRFTGGELMHLKGNRIVPFDAGNTLQHLGVVSIFEDNEHTLWLGTLYGGLTRITDNPFRHIGTPEGLVFDNMLAIFEDSRGRFWMSMRDYGVQVLENGRLRSYHVENGLVNEVIHTIAEDKDGSIWMGSHMAGVSIIHPDGTIENRNIGFVAGLNNVYAIFRASDNSMWLGTADGVMVYRSDGGTSHLRATDGLPANTIRYITEAADRSIWVATQGGGISRITRDPENPAIYKIDPGVNHESLRNRSFRAIYHDAQVPGLVWIGSEAYGLFALRNGRVDVIDRNSGLFDNDIHTITDTGDGNLWMSTNRGIFYINRSNLLAYLNGETDRVNPVSFTQKEGMRNAETNGGFQPAAIRHSDGTLRFSGQGGVVIIDPAIADGIEVLSPKMLITALRSGQNNLLPEGTVNLPAADRDFTVRYTGITFRATRQLQFKYMLEGYNRDWINAGDRREASFTNIPRGTYVFRVRGTNSKGHWVDEEASVAIVIPPLWYETTGFWAFVSSLLFLLIFGFIKIRTRQLREKETELEKLVHERTAELVKQNKAAEEQRRIIELQAQKLSEMNTSKDRFIHMLGHDIRNPLQGMLGTVQILHQEADTLEENERNQFVGMLKISVDRLNHLINDLLDWAQLESGMVQPIIRKVEIGGLLQKTCGLYHEVAAKKNVEIRIESGPHLEIETDPVMLETIFRNLLSNAIKFSKENSSIEISLRRAEDALEVHFRDSGIGMSPEVLGNLFKVGGNKSRSGTADEKGSGLGLLLVSELINILGGTVTVESRENEGTVFIVTVPLKQAPGE